MICFYSIEFSDLSIKSLKIKEAAGKRDENLFERSELFFIRGLPYITWSTLPLAVCPIVFSQDFIVSLDFFGSFLCQDKNEQTDNQYTK